jgi:DNA polymerase III subunit epsilon
LNLHNLGPGPSCKQIAEGLLASPRFVVFDVETTGMSPLSGHRIIEIGAVCLRADSVQSEFHSLIDPGRKVPAAAQKVHGICDAMLCGQPRPDKIYPEFHKFIEGAVLVAHNAGFDISFLQNEFARLRLPVANPVRCTLELSRRCLPDLPNYRLQTVARHLIGALPKEGRLHRALYDARLAARVWLALRDHFAN